MLNLHGSARFKIIFTKQIQIAQIRNENRATIELKVNNGT